MPIFWQCDRCTACCRWPGQVTFTEAELTRMALHLGLTEAGIQFRAQAAPAWASLVAGWESARSFGERPAGLLRLNMPHAVVPLLMEPILADFCARYPDIDVEIAAQKSLVEWTANKKERDNLVSLIAKQTATLEKEQKLLDKLETELTALADHKCHSCGQDLHDSKHEDMVAAKNTQAEESRTSLTEHQTELAAFNEALELVGELGACPQVHYDSLEQALNHKNSLAVLEKDVETKQAETNPYLEQIEELKNTAVQEISWDHANELVRVKEHQEFLYKLLTNKDSFVRKRIIDQNLAFLNQRLTYYLDKIGLPHIVEFQNDLTVIITHLGQDLDFDNLSRGERNRLILSMSWAFRDVWENLYHSINLLFIDELVDSGMDSSGVESSIAVLKRMTRERDKNVFLISHRDDLTSRVNHVLKVIKENGFTSYSNDIDIIE
jgi:DNA repair exonuclease SbcCD ATPase subunit